MDSIAAARSLLKPSKPQETPKPLPPGEEQRKAILKTMTQRRQTIHPPTPPSTGSPKLTPEQPKVSLAALDIQSPGKKVVQTVAQQRTYLATRAGLINNKGQLQPPPPLNAQRAQAWSAKVGRTIQRLPTKGLTLQEALAARRQQAEQKAVAAPLPPAASPVQQQPAPTPALLPEQTPSPNHKNKDDESWSSGDAKPQQRTHLRVDARRLFGGGGTSSSPVTDEAFPHIDD
jgi:hypothetical protein